MTDDPHEEDDLDGDDEVPAGAVWLNHCGALVASIPPEMLLAILSGISGNPVLSPETRAVAFELCAQVGYYDMSGRVH